jgi:glyoxylase-like metal-dependent hydrolase (beta-lactamase superfamily II)
MVGYRIPLRRSRIVTSLTIAGSLSMPAGVRASGQAEAAPGADAWRAVATAVDSLGGQRLLRAVRSIWVEGDGVVDRAAQAQGPRPFATVPLHRHERVVVDVEHQRAALEYTEPRDDGSDRSRRFSYADDSRTVVDFANRAAYRGRYPSAAQMRAELARRIPHLLLLEAYEHPAAVRALRDTTVAGVRARAVTFQPIGEAPLTLVLDAASALLSAVTYDVAYPGFPQERARVAIMYAGYSSHERIGRFPSGHRLLMQGRMLDSVRYTDVLVNDVRVDDAFAIPDDIAAQQASGGAITIPAPGVYVVNGLAGFTAMFVELRDFIVAIEAPAESYAEFDRLPVSGLSPPLAVSDSLIAIMHRTVPEKPIRYVVVSHFHNDHAGGVPAFWAAGATLITTPDARSYFEELGAAGSSSAGRGPPIEVVADRLVLSDGEREVVIYNTGPNGHTDQALVVWVPAGRILYQGDEFYYDGDQTFPPRDRLPVMRAFAAWVERSGLAVGRIYGTHMTGYAGMRHVRAVLGQDEPRDGAATAGDGGEGPMLSAAAVREDLTLARLVLGTVHPAAGRFVSREALDHGLATLDAAVHGAPVLDFWRQLTVAACAIGDGHTSIRLPDSVRLGLMKDMRLMPLPVRIAGDDVIVMRSAATPADLAGARVLAVNGQPSAALVRAIAGAAFDTMNVGKSNSRRIQRIMNRKYSTPARWAVALTEGIGPLLPCFSTRPTCTLASGRTK